MNDKPKKPATRITCFRFEPETLVKLHAMSKKSGRTKKAIMARALERAMADEKEWT